MHASDLKHCKLFKMWADLDTTCMVWTTPCRNHSLHQKRRACMQLNKYTLLSKFVRCWGRESCNFWQVQLSWFSTSIRNSECKKTIAVDPPHYKVNFHITITEQQMYVMIQQYVRPTHGFKLLSSREDEIHM